MPELPEVETVVREIRPRVVGKRFTSVEVGDKALRRRWRADWGPLVTGSRVREVSRRGKWILLRLDQDRYLVFHLGMTGNLTVVPSREPVQPHTHIVLGLEKGKSQLRFRDIRRFGSASVFPDRAHLDEFFREAGLGPEPWDLDAKDWRDKIQRTSRCLKAVLLDQRVVAGVGNIYADESLFTARLNPTRLGRETTAGGADRLRKAIVTVLDRAIEKRGSSIRNYVGGSGLRGSYQEEFLVYGRKGQPCPRCGRPIQCIRLAGRSTHFCPHCQPKSGQWPVGSGRRKKKSAASLPTDH